METQLGKKDTKLLDNHPSMTHRPRGSFADSSMSSEADWSRVYGRLARHFPLLSQFYEVFSRLGFLRKAIYPYIPPAHYSFSPSTPVP
jgi:hypothetical protein